MPKVLCPKCLVEVPHRGLVTKCKKCGRFYRLRGVPTVVGYFFYLKECEKFEG